MPSIDTDRIAALLSPQHDADTRRSEAARLADFIDQIDAAIARGVPRKDVLARLHEGGFTMSLRTFDKALHRIRKRLGKTAPGRRAVRPPDSPQTLPPAPRAADPTPAPTPAPAPLVAGANSAIKTREQLQREHPTLSSIQISKLVAQQYADPVLTGEQLDELKRRYNPPQIGR